jgi:hypothetical protein
VRGLGCPRSASVSSSRQRRSRCARQVWWVACWKRRSGAQPSRSIVPAQRLHLAAQPLVDLLEPFALGPQALVLHAQPFAFGLQPPLLLAQRGVLLLKPGDPPAQPGRASQTPTDLRTGGLRRHEARRLQPTHPASRTRCLTTAGRGEDPGRPVTTTTMAPAVWVR